MPGKLAFIELKDMKSENTFIVHPENVEQENALRAFVKALKIKFEVNSNEHYDPAFVEKIKESRKEGKESKLTRVNKEDLSDFLGL